MPSTYRRVRAWFAGLRKKRVAPQSSPSGSSSKIRATPSGTANQASRSYYAEAELPGHSSPLVCRPSNGLQLVEPSSSRSSVFYEPLLDKYAFRLLILHPSADRNAPIVCSLVHRNLRDRIDYTALSYVWGDPSPAQRILVNGHEVKVTPNLHEALIHLRGDSAGVLWVDALCINQKDVLERGHQVARMGEVYSQAHHVVSWLGPASEESTSIDDLEVDSRPYWQRAWIIQEFLMARSVVLMCGDWVFMEEDEFGNYDPNFGGLELDERFRGSDFWRKSTSIQLCRLREDALSGGRGKSATVTYPLDRVVRLGANAIASDPRDYVYSLLGLVDKNEIPGLEPDYTLSPCEVFCRTLRILSDQSHAGSREYREEKMNAAKHYRTFGRKHDKYAEDRKNCDGNERCTTSWLLENWSGLVSLEP